VIALKQTDLKRFIAWVSIAHVGLITAGVLSLNSVAIQGAAIQMISHGINVVGLFVITDIIQRRYNTREMDQLGGIARLNPLLGILLMIILLGTIALPLTNGFVGEFMLLLGLFRYSAWISAVAASTVIFSAVYMLRMYQKVMLGTSSVVFAEMKSLSASELITLIPLAIMVLAIGCFPGPFLSLAEPAIRNILNFFSVTPN
jgi:NADH-quinone oxidoreductase subunit M